MSEYASTKLLLSTSRAGPFISGVSHNILSLGQRPIIGSNSDEEGDDDPFATGTPREGSAKGRGRSGGSSAKKARGGVLTLQDLIDAGVIFPGRNNISVQYKGTTYTASLSKDGMILFQGKKFQSATSFSIHCKRMQTPNKQGDDGWKSVLYEGQPLDMYRKRLAGAKPLRPAARRAAATAASAAEGDEDLADVPVGQPTVAGAAAAAPSEALTAPANTDEPTDQWVQCDRCRTWRIVPDQHWPAVEADPREAWFCEYAMWNVALFTPYTPSCAR